jgi:hypothetical protein
MKKSTLLLLGAVAAFVSVAFAELPKTEGPPSLEYKTILLEGTPLKEHRISPYRFYDTMLVHVWDPVTCGQKPSNPNFSFQGKKLVLGYSLSKAPENGKECTIISEFKIKNVPHQDFEINFAGGPEPYVISAMKKCPYYKPKSDDIWECLGPTVGK